MIYDTAANSARYDGVSPHVAAALRFLRETAFDKLPDGPCAIDGDAVFANLMTYTTQPQNDTPEGHRAYIDLQYLITGTELVGVGRLCDATEEVASHPERDLWLYRGRTEPLTLGDGRFLLLWPEDIHAPGIAAGAPAPARKCVVKIRVD